MALIHEMLALAMAEIPAVGKDHAIGSGSGGPSYRFRAVDDFVNAVGPVFTRHGITMSWRVCECLRRDIQTKSGGTATETLLQVEYTLAAQDGSSVVIRSVGEGRDSGDKSANKAMSAALKYALSHALLIPTQDRSDSEYQEPESAASPDTDPAAITARRREVQRMASEHRRGCPDGLPIAAWLVKVRNATLGQDVPADTMERLDLLADAIRRYDPATAEPLPKEPTT